MRGETLKKSRFARRETEPGFGILFAAIVTDIDPPK
jgi:hypothetical protein